MLLTYRRLLRSSRPVMLMTAVVALFGVTGSAFAAKRLITGADIKNGSITSVDLAKSAHDDLKGARGIKGNKGDTGTTGGKGLSGKTGAKGGKGTGGGQGTVGSNGGQGAAGTNGAQGIPGTNGLNGIQGTQGPAGNRGDAGTAGTNGAMGTTGATGATGAAGVGTQGVPGTPAVRYFAAVASDSTLSTSRVSGVDQATQAPAGSYHLTLTGAPNTSTCVSVAEVTGATGYAFALADGSGNVTVTTFTVNGVQASHDFVVTVSC